MLAACTGLRTGSIGFFMVTKDHWAKVDAVWTAWLECKACAYCMATEQAHPCGEGRAWETLYECALLTGTRKHRPEECPGLD